MKLMRLVLTILAAGAVVQSASADEFGTDGNQFYDLIGGLEKNPSLETRVLLGEASSQTGLNQEQVQKLTEIASDQAQIWGDTILEGDYEAAGETKLDMVEGVYLKGELVAYRITYSEKAWYTGSCEYDYEHKESLAGCDEGRIAEASYVSPSFTTWLRDEQSYADFLD